MGPLLLIGVLLLAAGDPRAEGQADPPTVLITGFTPWGYRTINPSWEGAKRLNGETIEGHRVSAEVIEVDYRKVWAKLPKLLEESGRPAAVVHFGVWNARWHLERQARNTTSWGRDDSGYRPEDNRIVEDGPMLYTTKLPEKPILEGLSEIEPPIGPNDDAGGYLCEYTFYAEMYLQEKQGLDSAAGFVHVPKLRSGAPEVTAESLAKVMRRIIEITLQERKRRAPPPPAPLAEPEPVEKADGPDTSQQHKVPGDTPGLSGSLDEGLDEPGD